MASLGERFFRLRDDLSQRSGQKIQSVVKVYAFHERLH